MYESRVEESIRFFFVLPLWREIDYYTAQPFQNLTHIVFFPTNARIINCVKFITNDR